MKKTLLNECLRRAREKLHSHPEFDKYPHFTFLISENQIISHGVNRSHEPEKGWGYHNRILKADFRPKWHSEVDALRTNRHLDDFFAVNIRLNKGQETRLACPCSVCYRILDSFGCKACFFTTPSLEWGKIKF